MNPIYLDHHGTTPVDARVLAAMEPMLTEVFGNPSALTHSFGREAARRVDTARETVAQAIGADSREIVFTSGATESNNLALTGAARARCERGRHIVTAASEHKSVLKTLDALQRDGFDITVLPVDAQGHIDLDQLASAMRADTTIVSLMHANNEVGTLHPVAEIGALCRSRDVWFHCDAVQTVGKEPVNVDDLQIDLLSISGHKIYGPKGIGAMFVRRRTPLVGIEPLIHGAGHERGLRSGTLNAPGIIGLAAAVEVSLLDQASEHARITSLRDRLERHLLEGAEAITVNGDRSQRLAANLSVSIEGVRADDLLTAAEGIAVSAGSSCSSADAKPSHVLLAIGKTAEEARSSIRIGLGRFTSEEEVDTAASRLLAAIQLLRDRSPSWRMRQGAGHSPTPS